jgi:hypothetical protein
MGHGNEVERPPSLAVQVLIPFRGPLIYLQEAVESVRNSVGVRTSLLVIDDRPGKSEIPTFLDSSEYCFAGGVGVAKALQFSKDFLTEDYVAILAADDLVDSSRFTKQLDALRKSDSELCLCRMEKFSGSHRNIPSLSGEIIGNIYLSDFLLLGPYGADGTVLMTKDYFIDHFSLNPEDPFADWALALKEYPHSRIAFVNEKLYLYRQHSGQVTRNQQNPWSRSMVLKQWTELCIDLGYGTVDIQAMNVVAAPWFRSKPTLKDMSSAIELLGEIYANICMRVTNPELISSLERVILRRVIFRVTSTNFFYIMIEMKNLEIPKVRIKFFFELIKIVQDRIRQTGFNPRTMFPEAP